MTYQDLLALGFQITPDGRLFMPYGQTTSARDSSLPGGWSYTRNADGTYTASKETTARHGEDSSTETRDFGSLQEMLKALGDQNQFDVAISGGQNVLRPGTADSASLGTFGDSAGYFLDPRALSIAGVNAPTGSGWNEYREGFAKPVALSILGNQFLSGAGEAGGTDFGAGEGNYAAYEAAGGNSAYAPLEIGGSSGTESLLGDAGSDYLSSDAYGAGIDQYGNPTGEYAPSTFQGGGSEYFNPSTGSDWSWGGLWDSVKGSGKDAISFLNTPLGRKLLGAGLGAAAGSQSGGSKPAGTTTTIQDIPDWQKALLIPALTQSQGLLQSQVGQTSPLLGPAQDQFSRTIAGDYLNPASNPWLKDTYDQAAKSVTDSYLSTTQPRTDAFFYGANAFGPGNSAYAETVARNQFGLGQNLKNLATDIYGGNYGRERQNQLTATAAAPDFSQAILGTPWAPYKNFLNVAGGNFGSSVQQPYFTNKLGSIFSGAMLGSALLG